MTGPSSLTVLIDVGILLNCAFVQKWCIPQNGHIHGENDDEPSDLGTPYFQTNLYIYIQAFCSSQLSTVTDIDVKPTSALQTSVDNVSQRAPV